mmetsp:Transcript_149/g.166  ORF Transcript_149/g.166 Transcript_149/m.166 type:complete len:332 (-) Transcript_149:82-1077(-)
MTMGTFLDKNKLASKSVLGSNLDGLDLLELLSGILSRGNKGGTNNSLDRLRVKAEGLESLKSTQDSILALSSGELAKRDLRKAAGDSGEEVSALMTILGVVGKKSCELISTGADGSKVVVAVSDRVSDVIKEGNGRVVEGIKGSNNLKKLLGLELGEVGGDVGLNTGKEILVVVVGPLESYSQVSDVRGRESGNLRLNGLGKLNESILAGEASRGKPVRPERNIDLSNVDEVLLNNDLIGKGANKVLGRTRGGQTTNNLLGGTKGKAGNLAGDGDDGGHDLRKRSLVVLMRSRGRELSGHGRDCRCSLDITSLSNGQSKATSLTHFYTLFR